MRMCWLCVLAAAGCESGVTIDILYDVAPADGILVASRGGAQPYALAAVCGEALEHQEYTDHLGCKPDGEEDVLIEAWVVPAPETWDPALCDDPTLLGTQPMEDLPEPTDAAPYGSTEARWRSTPICGGILEAEVEVR